MDVWTYLELRERLWDEGYSDEYWWAEHVQLCEDADLFWAEYTWVVLSASLRNQVVQKVWPRIQRAVHTGSPIEAEFAHKGKAVAIQSAYLCRGQLLDKFHRAEDRLSFLESLAYIGPITKFHLARNLGLDFAKPDRHLRRIADVYSLTPHELCSKLAQMTGERIGTVDVVLWRAANLGFA